MFFIVVKKILPLEPVLIPLNPENNFIKFLNIFSSSAPLLSTLLSWTYLHFLYCCPDHRNSPDIPSGCRLSTPQDCRPLFHNGI